MFRVPDNSQVSACSSGGIAALYLVLLEVALFYLTPPCILGVALNFLLRLVTNCQIDYVPERMQAWHFPLKPKIPGKFIDVC